MSTTRVIGLMVVAVLGLAGVARGEDARKAKEHFDRGTTAYDLQRFAEAAREYELAYEAKNDPALLFNIGQAYRFAGEHAKAIGAFRSYLRRMPRAGNRAEVEARIVEMQKLLDEQKQSHEKPPTGTIVPSEVKAPERAAETKATPVEPTPVAPSATTPPAEAAPALDRAKSARTKKIAGLVVAGLGVALVAAGGASYGVARAKFAELDNPPPGATFDPGTQSAMKAAEGAGFALIGVGGAALIGGVVVAALGFKEGRAQAPVAIAPILSRDVAGAFLKVGF